MKLKRKKIGDRVYHLVDSGTGEILARAVQTGETSRDDFPWEWHLMDNRIFGRLKSSSGRSEATLRDCIDYIESNANGHGIYKLVGWVDPMEITEGDIFGYMFATYRAEDDARLEDDTITCIPVIDAWDAQDEVFVLPGEKVTLYRKA